MATLMLYIIYKLFDLLSSCEQNARLNQYYIPDAQPQKVYNVWMTAGNRYGNSLPSALKMIDTGMFDSCN